MAKAPVPSVMSRPTLCRELRELRELVGSGGAGHGICSSHYSFSWWELMGTILV